MIIFFSFKSIIVEIIYYLYFFWILKTLHNWHGNTLQSEWFCFARALAYIACVLVLASDLLKIVDMHTLQTRPNSIQVIGMQRKNISTNVLQRCFFCIRMSDAGFLNFVRWIAAVYTFVLRT